MGVLGVEIVAGPVEVQAGISGLFHSTCSGNKPPIGVHQVGCGHNFSGHRVRKIYYAFLYFFESLFSVRSGI